MGMFDSLHVELDGHELEIQTKRFDCGLAGYRMGDWISGSPPGVRVYFERLVLDANGKRVFGADEPDTRSLTLFVVLVHGIFVEYQFRDGELEPEAIEPILRELRNSWHDTARLQGFLVETLRTKQQRIASLERRLGRVRSVIASARRLQAGERLDGVFDSIREENRKLAAGENPLDVITWVLGDETPGWDLWEGGTSPDPLEEYRL